VSFSKAPGDIFRLKNGSSGDGKKFKKALEIKKPALIFHAAGN